MGAGSSLCQVLSNIMACVTNMLYGTLTVNMRNVVVLVARNTIGRAVACIV